MKGSNSACCVGANIKEKYIPGLQSTNGAFPSVGSRTALDLISRTWPTRGEGFVEEAVEVVERLVVEDRHVELGRWAVVVLVDSCVLGLKEELAGFYTWPALSDQTITAIAAL